MIKVSEAEMAGIHDRPVRPSANYRQAAQAIGANVRDGGKRTWKVCVSTSVRTIDNRVPNKAHNGSREGDTRRQESWDCGAITKAAGPWANGGEGHCLIRHEIITGIVARKSDAQPRLAAHADRRHPGNERIATFEVRVSLRVKVRVLALRGHDRPARTALA